MTNAPQYIGTSTMHFKEAWIDELHISSNTLYIGDTTVVCADNDAVSIRADPGQGITLTTTGDGKTSLVSAKGVNVVTEGGVTMRVSGPLGRVNIQSSGAGDTVNLGAEKEIVMTAPLTTISSNMIVKGDLTVEGTQLTVDVTFDTGVNLFVNGADTAASPGYSWNGDANTGIYKDVVELVEDLVVVIEYVFAVHENSKRVAHVHHEVLKAVPQKIEDELQRTPSVELAEYVCHCDYPVDRVRIERDLDVLQDSREQTSYNYPDCFADTRILVRCAPEKFDHNIIIFKDTQKVVRHPSQLTLIPDKVHRRFETMPFFIPMLKPSSSCGIHFGKLIHDIDTDWSVDVEEEAMHNRCTQPTYKKIINKKNVKKTKSRRAWILYVLEKNKNGMTRVKLTTSGEKEQFCSNVLNPKVSDKFVCKDLNSATAFNEEIRTAELLFRNVSASGLAKLTTFSLIPFKRFNVVGIDLGGKAVLSRDSGFYVFSLRCSMSAASKVISSDADMDKFVRETLENFDVIHRAGIIHGDVKLDNMIYCANDDRYRLINWGKTADHADMWTELRRFVVFMTMIVTRHMERVAMCPPMRALVAHAYTSFNLACDRFWGNPLFSLTSVSGFYEKISENKLLSGGIDNAKGQLISRLSGLDKQAALDRTKNDGKMLLNMQSAREMKVSAYKSYISSLQNIVNTFLDENTSFILEQHRDALAYVMYWDEKMQQNPEIGDDLSRKLVTMYLETRDKIVDYINESVIQVIISDVETRWWLRRMSLKGNDRAFGREAGEDGYEVVW
eukprot:gene7629-biopygen17412